MTAAALLGVSGSLAKLSFMTGSLRPLQNFLCESPGLKAVPHEQGQLVDADARSSHSYSMNSMALFTAQLTGARRLFCMGRPVQRAELAQG